MNEDFLHYVWKFQKFHMTGLSTTQGEKIQVNNVGRHNTDAGPDFLCAEVVIGNQIWAGMVELHIRSSFWYAHGHETDTAYDNVILHVVWEHDMEVYRKDGTTIPTLILKDRVELQSLAKYHGLLSGKNKWIYCENEFASIDDLVFRNWLDRLYFERLQKRSKLFFEQLEASKNDWEAVLFSMLCKNFGLKVNGPSFYSIANSVDYSVVKKCRQRVIDLEALLFGQSGLLEGERQDKYYQTLRDRYAFLKLKFEFSSEGVVTPSFFRLRPVNFPTIRLSQLSVLWSSRPHLFSELMSAKSSQDFYDLFQVSASIYWDDHFSFGTVSNNRKKTLTKKFIDLLLINTVIPLKQAYASHRGVDISEEIAQLAESISGEKNSIVDKFLELRKFRATSLESQALLQLKKNYCDRKKCLQCAIGNQLLKSE